MSDQPEGGKKAAAPRNNLKGSVLRKYSQASQLQGQDPNFRYEWKTTDENHPHCVDKSGRLEEHEYGNQIGGFVTVGGWQPVTKQTDPRVRQKDVRDDQGKGVDTLVRRGKQILCRIPREEAEKYEIADKAYQDAIEKQLYSPERQGDGHARMTAVVSNDPNIDKMQLLRNSGHPIPGIS